MGKAGRVFFTITGRLESLNSYTNSQRASKFGGAKMKDVQTAIVRYAANHLEPLLDEAYPVTVRVMWYEKDKKRDPDNIVFGKKFVLDGLQSAGVIRNDGWDEIAKFSDVWKVDKGNPRVEVTLSWGDELDIPSLCAACGQELGDHHALCDDCLREQGR